ncbi:putative Glycerol-3-phosphate acyltransferase 9 [Blattamonas nauphoetae]|uniref:Glycerol-3-phosphate acyltransferase 9 n=1 Tax=Blattamonas nauphoetae TaxID=2049346 RepID=A0ABQ9WYL1_9EUKA|nr:putative Glycerol-3-phosphate acyltransferase 9 [Blattamonas nauphoetae]
MRTLYGDQYVSSYVPNPAVPYNLFEHGFDYTTNALQTIVADHCLTLFEVKSFRPKRWTFQQSVLYLLKRLIINLTIFPLRVAFFIAFNVVFAMIFAILRLIPIVSWRLSAQKGAIVLYGYCWCISLGVIWKFHGKLPKHEPNMVYIINHTCMLDYMLVNLKGAFGSVGQKTPGFLGWIMKNTIDCCDNIWFDRFIQYEKDTLTSRIKARIQDPKKARLLIFPEGICTNNICTVQFKRGAFELDAAVVPIGIKYGRDVSDAYYWRPGFLSWCLDLMKSPWVKADIFVLPAMTRNKGESVEDFSKRVQIELSEKTGLVPTAFNGYLKYYTPSRQHILRARNICGEELCEAMGWEVKKTQDLDIPPLPSPLAGQDEKQREHVVETSKWVVDSSKMKDTDFKLTERKRGTTKED